MTQRLAGLALAASTLTLASPALADTLRAALSDAYKNNPTLQAARANQRATDESVDIQKSAGRPNASGTAQYTEYLKQSSTSFVAPQRSAAATVNLGVPIYSGGAVKNGVKAAETRVKAGQAGLRGTESAVFSNVVAAYMDVLRTQAVVGLSANQVDVLTVNLQATKDRFEIGDLTRTDVAQSQSRLAIAQSDLRAARSNLIAARETFIQLIGAAPSDLQAPPPLPGLPENVADAVDAALHDNPDLIAARERAQASDFDISVAGSNRLPRVSLFAGGSYNNYLNTLGGSISGTVPQASTAAQVGVQLTVPIFQGGLPAAQQRQAQARAAAALEDVVGAERSVIAQVRSAFASWQAANSIIASSQSAVAAAQLSLEGVRAENTVGNRTVLDILNAEQELINAQVQLVTARRNAYVAGFSLLAAMGRAEARDLGLTDEGLLYDPQVNYDRVKNKWFDWDRDPAPKAQSTSTVDIPAPDAEIPAQGDSLKSP